MRTPDTSAYRQLKVERRRNATLHLLYGGLANRWTEAQIRQSDKNLDDLEWMVANERRAKRRATQKRADDKRRGKV